MYGGLKTCIYISPAICSKFKIIYITNASGRWDLSQPCDVTPWRKLRCLSGHVRMHVPLTADIDLVTRIQFFFPSCHYLLLIRLLLWYFLSVLLLRVHYTCSMIADTSKFFEISILYCIFALVCIVVFVLLWYSWCYPGPVYSLTFSSLATYHCIGRFTFRLSHFVNISWVTLFVVESCAPVYILEHTFCHF